MTFFSLILTESRDLNTLIQDDKKFVDKILIGIDKMDRSDKKITLCKITFNLGVCKQLSEEVLSLSDTARNFSILFKRSEISSNSEVFLIFGWLKIDCEI